MNARSDQIDLSEEDALEIGVEAWIYLMPLVLMEITRRVMTNVPVAQDAHLRSPMGRFAHGFKFPDASFRDVVRPNVDTLYSMLWFDVGSEPLWIYVPPSPDRYHVFPLMDMWTDVFASVGTHTTQGAGGEFAIIGPRWEGVLPDGVRALRSPTDMGWILGRIQATLPGELDAVREMQRRVATAPLSRRGQAADHGAMPVSLDIDMDTAPAIQAESLSAQEFFGLATRLMKSNPPHATDGAILMRMQRLGIRPGEDFDLATTPAIVQSALNQAMLEGRKRVLAHGMNRRLHVNGWVSPALLGVYGNEYVSRTLTAIRGLGALPPAEAVYPTALSDQEGRPLSGDHRYRLRFPAEQLPPSRAFWSVTMYDEEHFLVANPIHRYAIGDRDALHYNTDGSIEILIQRSSPALSEQQNWLPCPAGPFTLQLRVYAPRSQAVDGRWSPPMIERIS